ncbi:hypothetical protein CERSUDRAFT_73324 [Gelatoporia subvermispora B]|uniref:DUF6533 domain-containing protein n=1 Tax=Ceriporiopsis subvermispora (strain B) TaxID=914234 RepID=M2QKB1_CERS8|nr:hypothetical protein CERSUDRAFT_73324 [Gelatoporia subvermispora B]
MGAVSAAPAYAHPCRLYARPDLGPKHHTSCARHLPTLSVLTPALQMCTSGRPVLYPVPTHAMPRHAPSSDLGLPEIGNSSTRFIALVVVLGAIIVHVSVAASLLARGKLSCASDSPQASAAPRRSFPCTPSILRDRGRTAYVGAFQASSGVSPTAGPTRRHLRYGRRGGRDPLVQPRQRSLTGSITLPGRRRPGAKALPEDPYALPVSVRAPPESKPAKDTHHLARDGSHVFAVHAREESATAGCLGGMHKFGNGAKTQVAQDLWRVGDAVVEVELPLDLNLDIGERTGLVILAVFSCAGWAQLLLREATHSRTYGVAVDLACMTGNYSSNARLRSDVSSSDVVSHNFTTLQVVLLASAALVIYDHLITFSDEVKFIWGRKLTSVTLLFYVNRWAIILWALCQISTLFDMTLPSLFCRAQALINDILVGILFATWSLVSAIRAHAVSLGTWWITIPVLLFTMMPVGFTVSDILTWTGWPTYLISSSYPPMPEFRYPECAYAERQAGGIGNDGWAVLVVLVTWCKTYRVYRLARATNVGTSLPKVLLRDGTLYFILLLPVYIYQFIAHFHRLYLPTFNLITPMSSIMCTHFLLDLRQAAYWPQASYSLDAREHGGIARRSTPLRFASFSDNRGDVREHGIARRSTPLRFASFIDNMGEDLMYGPDDYSYAEAVLGVATVEEPDDTYDDRIGQQPTQYHRFPSAVAPCDLYVARHTVENEILRAVYRGYPSTAISFALASNQSMRSCACIHHGDVTLTEIIIVRTLNGPSEDRPMSLLNGQRVYESTESELMRLSERGERYTLVLREGAMVHQELCRVELQFDRSIDIEENHRVGVLRRLQLCSCVGGTVGAGLGRARISERHVCGVGLSVSDLSRENKACRVVRGNGMHRASRLPESDKLAAESVEHSEVVALHVGAKDGQIEYAKEGWTWLQKTRLNVHDDETNLTTRVCLVDDLLNEAMRNPYLAFPRSRHRAPGGLRGLLVPNDLESYW